MIRPLPYLLVLVLTVPLLEIALLIQVGARLGVLPAALLVVASAVLGVALLRRQGLRVMRQLQDELAAGRMPAEALLEGVALLLAGVLLVTPGFFTDALGFLLLVPGLRRLFLRELARSGLWQRLGPVPSERGPVVIEGECWREGRR